MERVRWVWDPKKARANLRKHKISYTEAVIVFRDPLHLSHLDLHPDGDRWQTVGRVGPFLVLVVHTLPVKLKPGALPVGRIISARIATSAERRAYEEGEFESTEH